MSVFEALGDAVGGGNGCCERQNVYHLYSAEDGKEVYRVEEESGCCCRVFCNPQHKFNLNVIDVETKQQVMTFHHPFKCWPCCCTCSNMCRDEMTVFDGRVGLDNAEALASAQPIGHVKQPMCGGGLAPTLEIWDQATNVEGVVTGKGDPAFTVRGPTCCIGGLIGECLCDTDFNVYPGTNREGELSAKIAKLGANREGAKGIAKELFTDSDNFQIDFPAGATPSVKTGLLATTVLIDYMFFERLNSLIFYLWNVGTDLTLSHMTLLRRNHRNINT